MWPTMFLRRPECSLAQYVLIGYNLILMLLGIFLTYFAINNNIINSIKLPINANDGPFAEITNRIALRSVCLLPLGVNLALIASFGIFSAILENRRCLRAYMGFIALLFVLLHLGNTIYTVDDHNEELALAGEQMRFNMSIFLYRQEVGLAVQKMQFSMKCCGWNGPADWNRTQHAYFVENLPSSCCGDNSFTEASPYNLCLANAVTFNGCRFSPQLTSIASNLKYTTKLVKAISSLLIFLGITTFVYFYYKQDSFM